MAFRNTAAVLAVLTVLVLPTFAGIILPMEGGHFKELEVWEVDAEGIISMPEGKVQIYMAENLELTAERPSEATPFKVQVPDSFVKMSPMGFFGQNEEQFVGIWNSNQIRSTLLTAGRITFRFWVFDTGSRSGNFNLSLYKNEDVTAIVATATIRAGTINDQPRRYEANVPLSLNNTEFKPGDRLSLAIYATVNGGCSILYGSPDRDTGLILMNAEPLVVDKIKADTGGFEVWYRDSFGVRPDRMVFYAEADNKPLDSEEMMNKDIDMEKLSIIIRWNVRQMGGMPHEYIVAVSYGGLESTNVTFGPVTINVKGGPEENAALIILGQILAVFIVFIILMVAVSRFRRHRRDQMIQKVKMHRMRRQLIDSGQLPPTATMLDVRRHLIRTGVIKPKESTAQRRRKARERRQAAEQRRVEEAEGRRGGASGSGVGGDDTPRAVILEPVNE